MADKLKRFRAKPEERMKQFGDMRGISQAASALDAPATVDSGDMRLVPLDEIRVDPNNPRRLNLDWATVQMDPEDIASPRQRRDVEDIRGLSITIRHVGQRTPCELVREGSIFRIVFGERRYWATRLAEQATLKSIVLHSAPVNVPLIQLIENIQHKSMPLYETILNIRLVIEKEEEQGTPVRDATDLIARTGLLRTSAYRYWKYIDLPADVDQSLESRAIGTHDELSALLKFTTVKARKEALTRYAAGGSFKASQTKNGELKARRSRGGRPRTSISFGSTKNPRVAKLLLHTLDPSNEYADLQWDDPTAITTAWKTLLSEFERRVREESK